jgi:hypothetical protein
LGPAFDSRVVQIYFFASLYAFKQKYTAFMLPRVTSAASYAQ